MENNQISRAVLTDTDIVITPADNGYAIQYSDGVEIHFDIGSLLNAIIEYYEPGSRHSEKRHYVIVAPGDKHPDWSELHSKVIHAKD